jgi:hypothetical protein
MARKEGEEWVFEHHDNRCADRVVLYPAGIFNPVGSIFLRNTNFSKQKLEVDTDHSFIIETRYTSIKTSVCSQ